MITRLIIFLILKKLGLKRNQCFHFSNQKSTAIYYFTSTGLIKCWRGLYVKSGVSLNWLLDPECKETIIRDRDLVVADGVIRIIGTVK